MNQVLAKYFKIDLYSAQYIIDLATGKYIKLYWKKQFNIVLVELLTNPVIILPHFHQYIESNFVQEIPNNNSLSNIKILSKVFICINPTLGYDDKNFSCSIITNYLDLIYKQFYLKIYQNSIQQNNNIITKLQKYKVPPSDKIYKYILYNIYYLDHYGFDGNINNNSDSDNSDNSDSSDSDDSDSNDSNDSNNSENINKNFAYWFNYWYSIGLYN